MMVDKLKVISVCVCQNYVGRDGSGRQAESRRLIGSTIYELLVARHGTMSTFIRNKLSKLVVCVARQDWPHAYSDFFTNIYAVRHSLCHLLVPVIVNECLRVIGIAQCQRLEAFYMKCQCRIAKSLISIKFATANASTTASATASVRTSDMPLYLCGISLGCSADRE